MRRAKNIHTFGDWILTVRPVQMMHINRRKLVSIKSGNFPLGPLSQASFFYTAV